jgi:cytoskeletal protein RodZ
VGTFGDKFRAERDRRGFTLDDVSNVTKISARMLKAIEDEHFDQLPGGVFNKGFIRAYAKHLRLNDEEAVTDYLACLRQAQIDAAASEPERPRPLTTPAAPKAPDHKPVAPEQRASKPAKSAPPAARASVQDKRPSLQVEELPGMQLPLAEHVRRSRENPAAHNAPEIPWRIPAIVLLVIVIGVALWNRHSRSARAEGTSPATPPTAQNPSSPAPVLASNSSTAPSSSPIASGPSVSASSRPGGEVQRAPGDLRLPSAASPSQAPAPLTSAPPSLSASAAANKTSAAIKQPDPAEQDDVSSYPASSNSKTSAAKTSAVNPAAAKAPPTFTLVIRAGENSWISVAADGQTVTQETLIAPAHTSVRATREIVVRAGNAAAVSFLFNGKEIPAAGEEGEAKTFVFNSAGIIPAPPADVTH